MILFFFSLIIVQLLKNRGDKLKDDFSKSLQIIKQLHQCGHFLYYKMVGTSGRTRILRALASHGELLQKDLQNRLNIKSGSISDTIIKLEKEGLIKRKKCEKDARNMKISLTELGKKEGDIYVENFNKGVEDLTSPLTFDEKKDLIKLLEKTLDHWKDLDLDKYN